MQAYAEGYELLAAVGARRPTCRRSSRSWREGTVVRSWLLDLLVRRSRRTRSWPSSAATPRTPARAGGPSRRPSGYAVPLPVISAALFARFASRQDDSPAMKAVAALRNQFGGHAVQDGRPGPGGRRPVGHGSPVARPCRAPAVALRRLPVLRAGRGRVSSRASSVLVGPNGSGQDQPGRGARLRRHARSAPGRHATRRWSGAAPSGRSSAATVVHDGRELLRRAGDHAGQGQPGPAQPLPGAPGPATCSGVLRTVLFAPEDLALVRGDPAERRRYLDDCWSPRRRGSRGCAPTTTGCSSSATPCSRPPAAAPGRPRRRATCAPWTSGTATSPRTAPSCWPARLDLVDGARPRRPSRRTPRWRRRREPIALVYRSSLGGVAARRRRDELEPLLLDALARGRARQELERGVSLVGPHRDDLELTLGAGCRRRVRQPRRVLVVRAGAAAGRVRAAARRRRRAGAGARRRVRRAGHRRRRALADVAARPSRCWSPPRSPDDVPAGLGGVRFAVNGGRIERCSAAVSQTPTSAPQA